MFVLTWISPRHVPPSYIHNTAADEDPCTHRPFPADRCIARTRSAIRGLSVRLCTVRVCRFRIGPHSGGDAQRASSDNTAEHAEHVSSRRSTRSRNDRRTRTRTRGPCTATILLFSARLARLARGNALHGRALRARALRHPLLAPEMAVNRDRSGRPRRGAFIRGWRAVPCGAVWGRPSPLLFFPVCCRAGSPLPFLCVWAVGVPAPRMGPAALYSLPAGGVWGTPCRAVEVDVDVRAAVLGCAGVATGGRVPGCPDGRQCGGAAFVWRLRSGVCAVPAVSHVCVCNTGVTV